MFKFVYSQRNLDLRSRATSRLRSRATSRFLSRSSAILRNIENEPHEQRWTTIDAENGFFTSYEAI